MSSVRSIRVTYEKYAHKIYEETSLKKSNPMENVDVHRRWEE